MLRESDREAVNHCGAGRPEANSDSHKWTADGLRLDGSPCDYFQCRADLRGSSRPDSRQVNCMLLIPKNHLREAYHGAS